MSPSTLVAVIRMTTGAVAAICVLAFGLGGGEAVAATLVAQTAQQPATSPAPPPADPPPADAEPVGTPATVLDGPQAETLLGKSAKDPSGADMGRIVDVIVDKKGQIRAAVIDFGGFLGVGSRKIAVDWRSVHFPAENKKDTVVVDLPRDQLRVAPVYKEGEPVVVLGPAAGAADAKAAPKPATAAETPSP